MTSFKDDHKEDAKLNTLWRFSSCRANAESFGPSRHRYPWWYHSKSKRSYVSSELGGMRLNSFQFRFFVFQILNSKVGFDRIKKSSNSNIYRSKRSFYPNLSSLRPSLTVKFCRIRIWRIKSTSNLNSVFLVEFDILPSVFWLFNLICTPFLIWVLMIKTSIIW